MNGDNVGDQALGTRNVAQATGLCTRNRAKPIRTLVISDLSRWQHESQLPSTPTIRALP
jgi:hypothetical protein